MKGFVVQHYGYFLSGLISILMVLSFLIGREEGRAAAVQNAVVLSCSPEVLAGLTVPPPESDPEETVGIVPATPVVLSEDAPASTESTSVVKGKYMGSKNGTKYYTPRCPGAGRIKPENYIWFSSEEDATMQGYSKGSC